MRKKIAIAITILSCTSIFLAGCSGVKHNTTQENQSEENVGMESENLEPIMITYSFMFDQKTRDEVSGIMQENGVSDENIDAFMKVVKQFADTLGDMKGVQEGFATINALEPFYDADYIGLTFDKELKFSDQNCRLTAYSIDKQFVSVDETSTFEYSDDSLYGDLEILKDNNNLSFSDEDMRKYTALFASVKADNTEDVEVLAQNVKDAWEDRKVKFSNEENVQLASIMIQDPVTSTVYAGHAGVVFRMEDGYLLIEKLSQYTPFVAAKFKNLSDLNTYMLSEVRYFVQENAADPFIMLNNQLLNE